MNNKSSLRVHFLGLLKNQGSQERLDKSQRIAEKLFVLPAYVKAKTVLFYASLPGEVETFAMIEQALRSHKRVALPITVQNQGNMVPTLTDNIENLERGPHGVLQPKADHLKVIDTADIDAVIVPGLAFDKANNRLGRGAGYYDRFLASLPETTAKIGFAFDFQLVDCLPTEEHDVPLHHIIAN